MKKMRLIMLAIVSVILATGCGKKVNYATDEPFIIVTSYSAGPEDVRNMFKRNVSVSEDGTLVLYTEPEEEIKLGDDAPMLEVELTKNEVAEIKNAIAKNKFWTMKENLSDYNIQDGGYLYVTVNLVEESKTVGGLNPNNERLNDISHHVRRLIPKEAYRQWDEEITEHIFEMNP